jgi:predicted nucleic acid-binding protein
MGNVADLRARLASYALLLLDTMVLSYHLANHPRYAPLTQVVLQAVESGQVRAVVSTLTLAEVLTAPAQACNRQAMVDYELYLTQFPNLRLVAFDATTARETALVRASTGLRVPDAVQVATARICKADAIVTNDRRWVGRVMAPALVMLDDYVPLDPSPGGDSGHPQ